MPPRTLRLAVVRKSSTSDWAHVLLRTGLSVRVVSTSPGAPSTSSACTLTLTAIELNDREVELRSPTGERLAVVDNPAAGLLARLREPITDGQRDLHGRLQCSTCVSQVEAHEQSNETSLLPRTETVSRPSHPSGRFGLHPRDAGATSPHRDFPSRRFGNALATAANLPPFTPRATACITLDIDSDGMWRGRAIGRNLRELSRRNPRLIPSAIGEAILTNLRLWRDPHLNVRVVAEELEGLNIPATFFVQTHRFHRLDNYDLSESHILEKQLRAILKNRFHAVGLHSSYATCEPDGTGSLKVHPRRWNLQLSRIRGMLGHRISDVHRAHFLRAPDDGNYPWDGIDPLIDSSLGFGSVNGFGRHATCHAFQVAPNVLEIPHAVMDSTYRFHGANDPEAAYESILAIYDEVAAVGGCFVSVHHPHLFEPRLNPGWQECFRDMLSELRRRGATFQTLAAHGLAQHRELLRLQSELEASSK